MDAHFGHLEPLLTPMTGYHGGGRRSSHKILPAFRVPWQQNTTQSRTKKRPLGLLSAAMAEPRGMSWGETRLLTKLRHESTWILAPTPLGRTTNGKPRRRQPKFIKGSEYLLTRKWVAFSCPLTRSGDTPRQHNFTSVVITLFFC